MDKRGQVETGITPCAVCGRRGEATYKGESYCMSCYMKTKHQFQPISTKLASDHSEGAV